MFTAPGNSCVIPARGGLFDFQGEVVEIVEAAGDPFDDLDLVVHPLEQPGVHPMFAVGDDLGSVSFQFTGDRAILGVLIYTAARAGAAARLRTALPSPNTLVAPPQG